MSSLQKIDSHHISEITLAQETQMHSRRSHDAGMDYMMRLHSSENFSFEKQKQDQSL